MITWNNLDTLESFKELSKVGRVDIKEAMSGDNGAKRVKEYNIPMAEGFTYNFAAKQVDADVLEALAKLAKEAQLTEKFEALYNGAVINTGENRLVLHQLTRGQLGDAVVADGVDKRKFYVEQQERIAEFANKVHSGEITNAAGSLGLTRSALFRVRYVGTHGLPVYRGNTFFSCSHMPHPYLFAWFFRQAYIQFKLAGCVTPVNTYYFIRICRYRGHAHMPHKHEPALYYPFYPRQGWA